MKNDLLPKKVMLVEDYIPPAKAYCFPAGTVMELNESTGQYAPLGAKLRQICYGAIKNISCTLN